MTLTKLKNSSRLSLLQDNRLSAAQLKAHNISCPTLKTLQENGLIEAVELQPP
ncbi:MAG: hypothetical protein ACJAT7_002372 [Psychromonas sp.]|jgi:hypothetical protein|uniref:hypothetical protein n=1 Tax=Psychromonas sp. TaxID=1884585 RepID=UPI0039E2476F